MNSENEILDWFTRQFIRIRIRFILHGIVSLANSIFIILLAWEVLS